jgi:fructosamine-3-kinase
MNGELNAELERLLGEAPRRLAPVAGGDINQAFTAELGDGRRLFVKTLAAPPPDMYQREAEGLAWLGQAAALRVPRVLSASPRALVLEWIEARARRADFDELLGRGLARLHRAGAPGFGYEQDNFVGSLAQDNRAAPTWSEFYAERRLLPLARRALDAGVLSARLFARIERLCARLPALCGAQEAPSRLHGDLWSGNVMSDESGEPVLIDPAVYGGDREIDLAMLRLFGAPSARLFAAYDELNPRRAQSEERVALYQLYPLLVHVNLFGAGYAAQLGRAVERYE